MVAQPKSFVECLKVAARSQPEADAFLTRAARNAILTFKGKAKVERVGEISAENERPMLEAFFDDAVKFAEMAKSYFDRQNFDKNYAANMYRVNLAIHALDTLESELPEVVSQLRQQYSELLRVFGEMEKFQDENEETVREGYEQFFSGLVEQLENEKQRKRQNHKSELTKNSNKGAVPGKLECPRCDSGNVTSVPLAFQKGVRRGSSGAFMSSRGHIGVGASGPSMTEDAKSLAPPPEMWKFWFWLIAIGSGIPAVILGLIVKGTIGNGDAGAIVTFVGWFALAVFLFIWIKRSGLFVSQKKLDSEWENSFRCNRCGHQFVWYG